MKQLRFCTLVKGPYLGKFKTITERIGGLLVQQGLLRPSVFVSIRHILVVCYFYAATQKSRGQSSLKGTGRRTRTKTPFDSISHR